MVFKPASGILSSACIMALAVIALVVTAPAAWASKAAEAFVQERANAVMAIINNDSYSREKKKAEIGDILDESVDIEAVALYTLGKYRNVVSEADRDKYVDAFHDYLHEYYLGILSKYKGVTLKVTGSQDGGTKGTLVSSVGSNGGDDVELKWLVKDDSTILDFEIEGVSMKKTLLEQVVASLDRSHGDISAATALLQQIAHNE